MASYQKYASQFKKVGLYEDSLATEAQIKNGLDRLWQENGGRGQFDADVAQELWEETPKEVNDGVYIRNYIETILKGESILRGEIENARNQLQRTSVRSDKQQIMNDLASYEQDHQFLTQPFGIKPSGGSQYGADSRVSASRHSGVSNTSKIFDIKGSGRSGGSATDLKFAFLFALIALVIQIILMYQKHHFYSILAILAVFAIFYLDYFDTYYIKFVIVNLAISILFDFVWVFVHAGNYWNPRDEDEHTALEKGFLRFLVIIIFAVMVLKFLIGAILIKYRNNPINIHKQITFFGFTFPLTGAQDSPIAAIITGEHTYKSYSPN